MRHGRIKNGGSGVQKGACLRFWLLLLPPNLLFSSGKEEEKMNQKENKKERSKEVG